MKSGKNKKISLIIAVLVLFISIGYAALSTTLIIDGNVTLKTHTWIIYFTNVQERDGSVTPVTAPTTVDNTTTTISWAVNMDTPGQFYEFLVDIKNDGSVNAMVSTLSNTTLTTEQAKYLNYTVTYSDGATIEQYDRLNSGDTVTLKVRLEYKKNISASDLPATAETISMTYTLNYVQADENAKDRNEVIPLAEGNAVNYATSLNGVTLNTWKVLYIDGEYTYLIYSDYLPNSAVDIANIETDGIYGVYSNVDRKTLVDAITTKSNWDSLLTGTINGNAVNETRTSRVWAMGSPTIDMFIRFWNDEYPSDELYTRSIAMGDGLSGYYIGTSANPSDTYVDLSDKSGYNNKVFYPYQSDNEVDCGGYWLGSASINDNDSIMKVDCYGSVESSNYDDTYYAFRPIICLPTSVIE